jgi:hypothetical protein
MARNAMSSHARVMLEGRIVPTPLRVPWPNILMMVAQSASGLVDTWFLSRRGFELYSDELLLPLAA